MRRTLNHLIASTAIAVATLSAAQFVTVGHSPLTAVSGTSTHLVAGGGIIGGGPLSLSHGYTTNGGGIIGGGPLSLSPGYTTDGGGIIGGGPL